MQNALRVHFKKITNETWMFWGPQPKHTTLYKFYIHDLSKFVLLLHHT